ncbi:MAG TPA: HAMP domain-containing sensor histidine kinase [Bacteroidales bacterium]|nr:HAMP domain-containing sensor histidine kinase [Bacteroidales bacterium]
MLITSFAIYIFSAHFQKEDFYSRLKNRANVTARLLIEVDEIDVGVLKKIDSGNPSKLPEEMVVVFDYNDSILYNSDKEKKIIVTNYLLKKIKLHRNIRFVQGEYEALGFLYTGKTDQYLVVAAATDEQYVQRMKDLRFILIVVFIFGLILFSVSGWFFSGRALRPISKVVEEVEGISISSLHLRVGEGNGTDEIAHLAKTFNNMLDRLEVAFKIQKDFISNASHELRTPLTSIYGQMEVLVMKERSSDEYKSAISSVLEDIKNMIDLSNKLLLLAQASSTRMYSDYKQLRIDDIIWQAIEDVQKFNEEYKITFSIDSNLDDPEKMIIKGDDSLVKVSITNLIDNGCKYSANHSVEIKLNNFEGWIVVSVTDHGIGITPNDLDHVFEPFSRGTNVEMISGHGIGLSLVNRIMKNHNGKIEIKSEPQTGTEVLLYFPVI